MTKARTLADNFAADINGITAGTGITGGGTSGTVTVTNSMATEIDAKGDLVVGTGADTFAKLSVGTNGHTLVADSVETTGLKWAAVTAAGRNYSLLNAGGTTLTGATTITVSGISNYEKFMVLVEAASANAGDTIGIRINGDTAANYRQAGRYMQVDTSYTPAQILSSNNNNLSYIQLGGLSSDGASVLSSMIQIDGGTGTGGKSFVSQTGVNRATGNQNYMYEMGGIYAGSAVISSISIVSFGGNFDAGTLRVYASA